MLFPHSHISGMRLSTLALLGTVALAVGLASCKSFDESVRPVIDLDRTEAEAAAASRQIYMKGIKSISDADPSRLKVEPWRVVTDHYPDSIRLYVRVYDTEGYLITNLAPPHYEGGGDYRAIWNGLTEQVGVDGLPEPIRDFSVREFSELDAVPNEIALVLDYSGTMGTNIGLLEQAAVGFVRLKKPTDRIAVVKFDSKPKLASPATNSTEELVKKFGTGLQGFGEYTAMYSAAKLGGEQIMNAPAENPRALILFTDGEDNASTIDDFALLGFNKQHNIPIFTVAFGAVNRQVLVDLSTYSGGKFYQTESADDFKAIFEDIYRSLQNYYLISYKPIDADGRHIASVSLNPPGARSSVVGTIEYNTLKSGRTPYGGGAGGPLTSDTLPVDHIYFAYNSADLLPTSDPALDALADYMKEYPRREILVQGHTSSEGTDERNQLLSEQRAAAIRTALVARGVAERRITVKGYGKSVPIARNDTEAGRQRNRRVTIVLTRR